MCEFSAAAGVTVCPRSCNHVMNQGSVAATVAKGSIVATDDGVAREVALKQEAESWKAPNDASSIPFASPKDIPVLDLARYCSAFESNAEGRSLAGALEKDASCHAADELKAARDEIAAALCDAGQRTGFCTIQGFDAFVSKELLEQSFAAAENFHSLTESDKLQYEMDDPSKVGDVGGVGYLREQNRKLPARTKANFNGSFIVKREHGPRNVTWDCMPWPHDSPKFDGARFRDTVTRTAAALERLALALLPVYAVALGLDADYFDASFESPLLRMRLSCYPHTPPGEFGINPHVDTRWYPLLSKHIWLSVDL